MAIGISTAYGRWKNEQKAAGRRPEDGVTALFVLGKRAERAEERPEGMGAGLADCRERSAATVRGAGGKLGENGRTI